MIDEEMARWLTETEHGRIILGLVRVIHPDRFPLEETRPDHFPSEETA